MKLFSRSPGRIGTHRLVCDIVLADTNYTTYKKGTTLIDPTTGEKVQELATIVTEEELKKIAPLLETTYYSARKHPFVLNIDNVDINRDRFVYTPPSAYMSPGCLIFNSAIVNLQKWALDKDSCKYSKDALEILLTTMDEVPEKNIKSYMKKITKAFIEMVKQHQRTFAKDFDKKTPENIHLLINSTIHNLVLIPTFVALVFCSCFPYGDSKCVTIFNELTNSFPEEVPHLSAAIDYYLLQAPFFNTKGILEKNGGKISLDYVRMVALTAIGPEAYVNLHILKQVALKYSSGQIGHEEFKTAVKYSYTDKARKSSKLKGQFNSNVYVAPRKKYCNNCNWWWYHTLRVGFISVRFGYDIVGHILGVPPPGSLNLNLNDKFNIKRQDLVVKYEEAFLKYGKKKRFYDSSDLILVKVMSIIGGANRNVGKHMTDNYGVSFQQVSQLLNL